MKKIIIIFCSLFLFQLLLPAQVNNMPREVKDAFQANYPGVTDASWNYQSGSYEADFNWNGRQYRSVYDRDGNLIENSITLNDEEIPAAVKDGFTASEYRFWNIDNISRIELPDEQIYYRYDLSYEDYTERLEMYENGTYLLD